jgi:hypothetical protein
MKRWHHRQCNDVGVQNTIENSMIFPLVALLTWASENDTLNVTAT